MKSCSTFLNFKPCLLWCLAITYSIACNRNNANSDKNIQADKNGLSIDSLTDLPEMKSVSEQLSRRFPEMRLTLLVQGEPSVDSPYHWVQFGFMTDKRFEPYLNFYIGSNKQVRFLDTTEDTIVSFQFFESHLLPGFLQ